MGVSWPLLGAFWTSLSGPLEPRGGKTARKWSKRVQRAAQEVPKGSQNGVPKSCLFVSFSGPVFGPFSGLPFGGFLGRLVSPKLGFRLGGPTKTLLPPGRLQERKITENEAKTGPQIDQKTQKKRRSKRGSKIKRNLPPGPPQGSAECGPKIRGPPRMG